MRQYVSESVRQLPINRITDTPTYRFTESLSYRPAKTAQKGLLMLLWGLFTLGYVVGAMFSAAIFSNRRGQE